MALHLGIMIDRYNNHASRGRTVLLSVTPSLDGKLFGALFGVGLFLNSQIKEQGSESAPPNYFSVAILAGRGSRRLSCWLAPIWKTAAETAGKPMIPARRTASDRRSGDMGPRRPVEI